MLYCHSTIFVIVLLLRALGLGAYPSQPFDSSHPHSSNGTSPTTQTSMDSGENIGERDRDSRIKSIKTHILAYLGISNGNGPPEGPVKELQNVYKTPGELTIDEYPKRVQNIYPSCEIPKNTDEETWSKGDTMNLYFDVSLPSPKPGNTICIITASLKLFKLSPHGACNPGESCPTPPDHTHKRANGEDKYIRVSVYWYPRPLRKNRVKRKLLDSQMISLRTQLWTDWMVKPAVKSWMESGKNFGIAVEVEDEDGQTLQASKYFSHTLRHCGKEFAHAGSSKKMMADAIKQLGLNATARIPSIELRTILVPEVDNKNLFKNTQYDLDREPGSDRIVVHKVRHHHSHQHQTEPHDSVEQISWEDGTLDSSKKPRNQGNT